MKKKYKLKQSVKQFLEDLIVCLGITTFAFTGLSLISWKVKEYNNKMIELEYNKKTDTSKTYISQKN